MSLPYSVSPAFFDFGEGKTTGQVTLSAGAISSTLDRTVIGDTSAQDSRNVRVDRGVWELDRRYRMAQLGKGTGMALGYVQSYAYGRLIALQGNRPYWYPLAPDSSALDQLGGYALTHGPIVDADLPIGNGWSTWTFGSRLFAANGLSLPDEGESSVYFAELNDVGDPVWTPQYLNYKPEGLFTVDLERPDYPSYTWSEGADSVADGPDDHFGKPPTIMGDGRIYADNTNYDPTGLHTIKFSVIATIGQTNDAGDVLLDLSSSDYVGISYESTYRMWGDYVLGFLPQGGSWFYAGVKAIATPDEQLSRLWFDISGLSRELRAKITQVNIRGSIRTNGKDGAYLSPLLLGGSFLNGTTEKPSIKGDPSTAAVKYAAQYWTPGNGGSFSTGMYVSLDGTLALGEKSDSGLPDLGAIAKLSVVKNQSAPFNAAGSLVYFYRQVGERWYLLGSADNTGDLDAPATHLDHLRQSEVLALPDVTDRLSNTPYTASASGGVPKINGGVEWKGSNCYFDTDGRLYISRTDDYTDVLWTGIVRPTDFDDIGQPRSLQVSGMRDPILCAVATDALWLFTRRETYVMAGARPSSADPPFRMMGVRGAVSKRSAALYETGAVVATDEGLYYLYLDRPLAGVAANQTVEELTKDVRGHWSWLLGSSPELTTVTVHLGEIYVVNGARCLHLTKDGQWLPNEYAHSFADVWADPRFGLVGLTVDGELCPFGFFPTDGGTDAAGESGTPVSWWWTSKRFTEAVNVTSVRALYDTDLDNAVVSFDFASHRGSRNVPLSRGSGALFYDQVPVNPQPIGTPWWELTLRGSGFDRLQRVTLGLVRVTEARQ